MTSSTHSQVLVTGGAGFIGSHLARALMEAGHTVHIVDNYVGGRFPDRHVEGAIYHEGDMLDGDFLNAAMQGIEYVFHCAALPRVQYSIEFPEDTNRANVGGTLAVLEAARKAGVKRVVYSASSSAYGDQDIMPLVETMTAHPQSPYALQKYIGELYCRMYAETYGLSTVCLRYFNVYGPHADPHGPYALVIARFIEQRLKNEPLTIAGDGTNTRDYTHVRDIVRANLLAAWGENVGKGEVMNIGGGEEHSVLEVAEKVGGPTVHVEARMEPKRTKADVTRAKELLGWEPQVSFAEGVQELIVEAGLA